MLPIGRLYAGAACVLGTAGSVLIAAFWHDATSGPACLGFALLILSGVSAMAAPLVSRHADLAKSYQAGWEAGYHKGRRAGRPTVVALQRPQKGA